jgi:hypothetical protein
LQNPQKSKKLQENLKKTDVYNWGN